LSMKQLLNSKCEYNSLRNIYSFMCVYV